VLSRERFQRPATVVSGALGSAPRRDRGVCETGREMAIETNGDASAATPGVGYEAVIGIEVHCQLRTESKMFCACSTAYDGALPNTHVCPVCLGLPGALPVINRRAVELVLATGIAIEATPRIQRKSSSSTLSSAVGGW